MLGKSRKEGMFMSTFVACALWAIIGFIIGIIFTLVDMLRHCMSGDMQLKVKDDNDDTIAVYGADIKFCQERRHL